MADAMADFEDLNAGKPVRERDETGKFRAAPKEKPTAQPAPEKPAAEVQKPAGEVAAKPEDTSAPKSPMRALGEKYDTLKKEVETTFKPTIQRLESKLKELETKAASPELTEQVNHWKSRAEAAEKKVETVNFTQSQKYQDQYQKPYVEAWNRAVAQFRELTIREQAGENELGEPIINSRPADENDLLKLANLKLSEMDEAVSKLFGASAPRVLQHIEKLKELATARRNAEQEADKRAVEARKEEQANGEVRIKHLADTWTEVNKSLEEKFPKAFRPEENDTEDAAAHTRGFALGDLLFIGETGLRPDQIEALPAVFRDTIKAHQPLSDAQRVQLHALARLKIANHDRQVSRVKKLQARVAELEKNLADYEKSEPGGRPGARESKTGDGLYTLDSAQAEISALDR
jgi:hypothetical protein